MRTLKKFAVLAVAVFAVSVVGVSSASAAAQFTASAKGNLEGHATENQVFVTNAGTVTCEKADTTGEIVSTASAEQEVTVNYTSCTAFGIVNVDISPATYNFTATGQVHIKSPITITVTGGIFGNCTVTVPAQTVGTATFANAGTSNITVNPNVKGIHYTGSGGLCGSGSAENGTYTGKNEVNRKEGGTLRYDEK